MLSAQERGTAGHRDMARRPWSRQEVMVVAVEGVSIVTASLIQLAHARLTEWASSLPFP